MPSTVPPTSVGSGESGRITRRPDPIAKAIVLPGARVRVRDRLAQRARPLSFVFVTVNVAAESGQPSSEPEEEPTSSSCVRNYLTGG